MQSGHNPGVDDQYLSADNDNLSAGDRDNNPGVAGRNIFNGVIGLIAIAITGGVGTAAWFIKETARGAIPESGPDGGKLASQIKDLSSYATSAASLLPIVLSYIYFLKEMKDTGALRHVYANYAARFHAILALMLSIGGTVYVASRVGHEENIKYQTIVAMFTEALIYSVTMGAITMFGRRQQRDVEDGSYLLQQHAPESGEVHNVDGTRDRPRSPSPSSSHTDS